MQVKFIQVLIICIVFAFALSCKNKTSQQSSDKKDSTQQNSETKIEPAKFTDKVYKHYKGTINKNLNIRLGIARDQKQIFGSYFYENVGLNIPVSGKIEDDGSIQITEKDEKGTISGIFTGKIEGSSFKGTWENGKKTAKFDLDLQEDFSESIEFEYITFSDSIKAKKDPHIYCKIEVNYLDAKNFSDKNVLENVKKIMLNDFFNEKSLTGNFSDAYKNKKDKTFKDFAEGEQGGMNMAMSWSFSTNLEILLNDYKILCYGVHHYEFSGGVHPNGASKFSVIDCTSGKVLKNNDVFIAGSENKLTQIIIKKILEQKKLTNVNDLSAQGYMVDQIKPTDNFYISLKGIGYYFNAYEIAPYVVGSTEVIIPFSEIKDLLNQSCIISKIIK